MENKTLRSEVSGIPAWFVVPLPQNSCKLVHFSRPEVANVFGAGYGFHGPLGTAGFHPAMLRYEKVCMFFNE